MQAVLAAGLILASSLSPAAVAAKKPPQQAPPLAGRAETAAMLRLERTIADSIQQGHVVPIDYGTPERIPGDVVGTHAWGDSGLWTGVYVGGESMRLATARHHLARGPKQDRRYWTAQHDQALGRMKVILAAQHRDINIAEDWTGSPQVPPHVNTANPGGTHAADFGGGIIKGERGMIMRSCTPVGLGRMGIGDPTVDAANPVNNNSNRVFRITWTSGDKGTYNCEASPSRDTYAGLTFGLLTAYDLLGPGEKALRDQIRADLLSMGNFLLKYGWTYPRPHGYVSAKHDFDGAISPLFAYVPMARLNLTNAVRHVLADGGAAEDKLKWDAVWAEELATQGPILAASMEIDSLQPNDGYYKFNLHHLTSFNLLRTTKGAERALFAQAVGVMDKTTRDDANAHFEAITFAMTGDRTRLQAAGTHLRQWLTYRSRIESGPVINSPKCGKSIVCVPEDQYDLDLDSGPVTWFPGQPELPPLSEAGKPRAQRPLPVTDRAPSDFIWQRPPTQLDGSIGPTERMPGIDFLTPYWMIRYFTEVARPEVSPFPEWAGPAHL